MTATCPWCGAPRLGGAKCPKCGAIYAKAEALQSGADPAQVPEHGELEVAPLADSVVLPPPVRYHSEVLKPETPPWSGEIEDLDLEWKLRLGAIPLALLLAALFHASAIGHFLQHTFLSMMVHEIGHAVTAWWCGYFALPMLWQTWIATHRSLLIPLGIAVANGYLVVLGVRSRSYALAAAGAVSALLQVIGTLILARSTAQALITFGGDAGALLLGTALMATFFFGRETQIYQGWLRWGFLVIGAAAFVDTFATWWAARSNYDAIPFGEIEGVGRSDPSKLIDIYGWTTRAMIHRYVALGLSCAVALAALWSFGVRQAWNEAAQLRRTRG